VHAVVRFPDQHIQRQFATTHLENTCSPEEWLPECRRSNTSD
jgi:hypothetical protein